MRSAPLHALAVLLATAVSAAADDDIAFASPLNDIVVTDAKVRFHGTFTSAPCAPAASVKVIVGDAPPVPGTVTGQDWAADGVDLPFGTWNVTVQIPGRRDNTMVITRGKGVTPGANRQKLRFVWAGPTLPGGEGVEDVIRDIARKTLDPPPTGPQLDGFVELVKARTVVVFQQTYLGINGIEQELVSADGPNVHTVLMLPRSGDIYGQTDFDCGNSQPQQSSDVWVGTYRDLMARYFAPGGDTDTLNNWAPMHKNDPLRTRAYDIAYALGRTAAHETGHGLGLVGSDGICGWMLGCSGGHNCGSITHSFPKAQRFNSGWHIMDPGEDTLNRARLAQSASTSGRDSFRTAAAFNSFNRSYLTILQP